MSRLLTRLLTRLLARLLTRLFVNPLIGLTVDYDNKPTQAKFGRASHSVARADSAS
jgi:hypothetical protein